MYVMLSSIFTAGNLVGKIGWLCYHHYMFTNLLEIKANEIKLLIELFYALANVKDTFSLAY